MCASTKWLCSHTIVLICVNNQPKFCEKKRKVIRGFENRRTFASSKGNKDK